MEKQIFIRAKDPWLFNFSPLPFQVPHTPIISEIWKVPGEFLKIELKPLLTKVDVKFSFSGAALSDPKIAPIHQSYKFLNQEQ